MTIDTVLNPPTVSQQKAALGVALAVSEAIREAGEIPSGHLYAHCMTSGMSLESYQGIIRALVSAGLVSETAHLLKWIGPTLEAKS